MLDLGGVSAQWLIKLKFFFANFFFTWRGHIGNRNSTTRAIIVPQKTTASHNLDMSFAPSDGGAPPAAKRAKTSNGAGPSMMIGLIYFMYRSSVLMPHDDRVFAFPYRCRMYTCKYFRD